MELKCENKRKTRAPSDNSNNNCGHSIFITDVTTTGAECCSEGYVYYWFVIISLASSMLISRVKWCFVLPDVFSSYLTFLSCKIAFAFSNVEFTSNVSIYETIEVINYYKCYSNPMLVFAKISLEEYQDWYDICQQTGINVNGNGQAQQSFHIRHPPD